MTFGRVKTCRELRWFSEANLQRSTSLNGINSTSQTPYGVRGGPVRQLEAISWGLD
jgi:hypothetical protein